MAPYWQNDLRLVGLPVRGSLLEERELVMWVGLLIQHLYDNLSLLVARQDLMAFSLQYLQHEPQAESLQHPPSDRTVFAILYHKV